MLPVYLLHERGITQQSIAGVLLHITPFWGPTLVFQRPGTITKQSHKKHFQIPGTVPKWKAYPFYPSRKQRLFVELHCSHSTCIQNQRSTQRHLHSKGCSMSDQRSFRDGACNTMLISCLSCNMLAIRIRLRKALLTWVCSTQIKKKERMIVCVLQMYCNLRHK